MCGICGYLHKDSDKIVNKEVIKRMNDSLVHRGPDQEGFYLNNNVAFGHRRLSIIDLSTGEQPMFNEDKSIVLIFNGEIYNYIELRDELKKLGCNFYTNSDSEVILRAYETWGIECPNRFNGAWSFAIWDDRLQQLFLSRDRIGEKPLFYTYWNDTLVFASEIKAIEKYGVPLEPRPELLELYLFFTNIPGPDTFYKDIFKLKPGHYLLYKNGKYSEHQYWDLPYTEEGRMLKNTKQVYEEFEYLFRDAVKLQMRSDVPYGAFLSGGLDSSSIVALMAEQSSFPI